MPEQQPSLPPLNLSDPDSILAHRNLLVASIPEILAVVDAEDQIAQFQQGRFGEVTDWFAGYVSGRGRKDAGHGTNAGSFGLTEEQTRQFNPIARDNSLIAPDTKLWTPDADLPAGAKIGDIADYRVEPDYDTLSAEQQAAGKNIVVDALFDGTIGRIRTGLGVAARSDAVREHGRGSVVVLTGARKVTENEGKNTGLYKGYLPEGTDPDTPIDQVFQTATDSSLAILRKECSKFYLVHQVDDPNPEQRMHPEAGGHPWVAQYYDAVHAETGARLLVTVVNGRPIAPTGAVMNRNATAVAPVAAETMKDYLALPFTGRGDEVGRRLSLPGARDDADANLVISFSHLDRIGGELRYAVNKDQTLAAGIGRMGLVGNMPQRATWERRTPDGKHNGGTLGYKEAYPKMRALGSLLGIASDDLRQH